MDQEQPEEENNTQEIQLHAELKAYVAESNVPLLEQLDVQNLCDFLQDVHLK